MKIQPGMATDIAKAKPDEDGIRWAYMERYGWITGVLAETPDGRRKGLAWQEGTDAASIEAGKERLRKWARQ